MANQYVDNCQECLRRFGFMNRKHHCRICEQIFCGKCSNQQMQMVNSKAEKVRMCNKCNSLKKEMNLIRKEKK